MDFTAITAAVKAAQLSRARLTDAKLGHTYTFTEGDQEKTIGLISEKKHKIPAVSYNSLANFKIVDDEKEGANVGDTRSARDNEKVKTLQYAIENDGVALSGTMALKVVGHMKIKDTVNNNWVYKNECYNGFKDFVDEQARIASELKADPSIPGRADARNAAFTKATNALRASGLRPGVQETPANLQYMPVFYISSK